MDFYADCDMLLTQLRSLSPTPELLKGADLYRSCEFAGSVKGL